MAEKIQAPTSKQMIDFVGPAPNSLYNSDRHGVFRMTTKAKQQKNNQWLVVDAKQELRFAETKTNNRRSWWSWTHYTQGTAAWALRNLCLDPNNVLGFQPSQHGLVPLLSPWEPLNNSQRWEINWQGNLFSTQFGVRFYAMSTANSDVLQIHNMWETDLNDFHSQWIFA